MCIFRNKKCIINLIFLCKNCYNDYVRDDVKHQHKNTEQQKKGKNNMWYEICINDDLYEVCYDTQEIIKISCEIVALGVDPESIKVKEHK